MKNDLTIAGIQAPLIWESAYENRLYFEEKIKSISEDVDLVVLPEMFSTGFTMNAKKVAEKMAGKTVLWMQKMAAKKNTAIVGSLVVKENNHFYNRLIFAHPNQKIDFYDKHHTFTLAGEHKIYASGKQKTLIEYKGWKICGFICYDLRFPVWSRNTENYDLLLYVASWPIARIKAWEILIKARAIENMSYVIGVNRIGIDDNGYEYSGNSLIVDYQGNSLATLKENEEGILLSKIKKNEQEVMRKKMGFLNDKDTFLVNLKTI